MMCAAFFKLEKIQLESFSLQFIIGYILGLFSRNGTTKISEKLQNKVL